MGAGFRCLFAVGAGVFAASIGESVSEGGTEGEVASDAGVVGPVDVVSASRAGMLAAYGFGGRHRAGGGATAIALGLIAGTGESQLEVPLVGV